MPMCVTCASASRLSSTRTSTATAGAATSLAAVRRQCTPPSTAFSRLTREHSNLARKRIVQAGLFHPDVRGIALHQLEQLTGGHRWAAVIALILVAADAVEKVELLGGLDAFSDYGQPQAVRQ